MKEFALARLDREEVQLLPAREALAGIDITNVVALNLAVSIAAFSEDINTFAGQAIGIED